jgi:peptidoglycan L-alanyl-D-glutamate endopeptidase CwlK
MYSFSQRSKNNLLSTHQLIQKVFNEVIKHYDCSIIEGHRGEKEQNEAFDKGFSKVRYPNSKHNQSPSMAADVVPYPIDWKDTSRLLLFAGIVIGISKSVLKDTGYELISGVDWDNDLNVKEHSFMDYPHFELKQI